MKLLKLIALAVAASVFVLSSCNNGRQVAGGNTAETNKKDISASTAERITPLYAQGFKVTYTDNGCLLEIQDPQREESQVFKYFLIDKGAKVEAPNGCEIGGACKKRNLHDISPAFKLHKVG